ncbi:hypothetical protein CVT24_003055 [Panaeolus cyanescens]|uniref:Dicer-like protein 1 n=1 Tax=Panaeolus cyanescens TaxID=181874 RepID=A0A409VFR1_9AGAR|nr:hypothetical protein CVT24_003055 [Panaeolus cyanescens]
MIVAQKDDIPRKYQEEIFLRAQKDNIIAALNTGSGKTLISLLLIKWIAGQDTHKGKVIVFLVPQVTLVKQQATYLQQRLPSEFKVSMLHGALDLDLTDRKGWKKRIEGSGVLVMTAQIFLNILAHSLWSLSKVSLLIFDECHHARKNHPYNVIMREYFHTKGQVDAPKVFGMTASPMWDVKDPKKSMEELEKNLDAKIIGVREHVDEMEEHSARPSEVIRLYPYPPETYIYPSPTIYQALSIIDTQTWETLDFPWPAIENRYQGTLYNLGLIPASMFLFQEVQYHTSTFLKENRQRVLLAMERDEDSMVIETPSDDKGQPLPSIQSSIPDELYLIIDILVDYEPVFFPRDPSLSLEPALSQWTTPKVHTLIDLLVEYHSPVFQCIIFVEQRQTASTLARILALTPRIRGKIRPGHLVGTGVSADGLSRPNDVSTRDVVQDFRDGKINTLIATSVAEEGLDFKECDLVVRFDGLKHNVSYVQSRGRARKKSSTFVVMVAEGDEGQIALYETLREKEPALKQAYQTRHMEVDQDGADTDEEEIDDTHPADLAIRERHVEATGAILTYDNCLNLLSNLCSLIPRDQYTSIHAPVYAYNYVPLSTTLMADPSFDPYAIGYSVTVTLPGALSLPRNELLFEGPIRRTKREAKRAAVWKAVRRLRELDVFDEHFYAVPVDADDDADGSAGRLKDSNASARKEIKDAGPVMNVNVVDPWVIGQKLWIHLVLADEEVVGGLICSTAFQPLDIFAGANRIRTLKAKPMPIIDEKAEKLAIMNEFTQRSVWIANNAKKFSPRMSFYFVPVTKEGQPDFQTMDSFLKYSRGCDDWSFVNESHYDNLFVHCKPLMGAVYLLHRIREDLSPLSKPPQGSREGDFPTYQEFWNHDWSGKRRQIVAPGDGPLVEVIRLSRNNSADTSLASGRARGRPVHTVKDGRIYPLKCCTWYSYPVALRNAYLVLPELAHQLTVHYRAQRLRTTLSLPPIPSPLLIEASTIPSANKDYSNQRLETLGDAVLQVLTTVHLFMHYPNRHEGQLTRLRQRCVANRYLFHKAHELGLEKYVNTETPQYPKWRYVLPEDTMSFYEQDKRICRETIKSVPRRSLQDCMEALMGASYLSGGMDGAMQTASVLGMEVGAPVPWFMRSEGAKNGLDVDSELPLMFQGLERDLGYRFKRKELLREALTHPSFATDGPSYQRLEFLGDAILDLVVTEHLFHNFPSATSHQLSHARARAICSPTLAHVAVFKLKLHNLLLVNSVDLSFAIEQYLPILQSLSAQDVLRNGWRYDPPKAISDVFESVMGAVFVDTGYNFEETAQVMQVAMDEVLQHVSPEIALDPMSELTRWVSGSGCQAPVRAQKQTKQMNAYDKEGIAILLHGTVVSGPVVSTSLQVAKFMAAEIALTVLKKEESDLSLKKICVCSEINSAADLLTLSSVADPSAETVNDQSAASSTSDSEEVSEVESILLETKEEKSQDQHVPNDDSEVLLTGLRNLILR